MLSGLFNRRIRGFRVVEMAGVGAVLALALGSYAFKTFARNVDDDTANLESQISTQQMRIHLLKAEIAHLDSPDRIERLATQYLGMQAENPKQEITVAQLPQIAVTAQPPVASVGAPSAAPPSAAASPTAAASPAAAASPEAANAPAPEGSSVGGGAPATGATGQ